MRNSVSSRSVERHSQLGSWRRQSPDWVECHLPLLTVKSKAASPKGLQVTYWTDSFPVAPRQVQDMKHGTLDGSAAKLDLPFNLHSELLTVDIHYISTDWIPLARQPQATVTQRVPRPNRNTVDNESRTWHPVDCHTSACASWRRSKDLYLSLVKLDGGVGFVGFKHWVQSDIAQGLPIDCLHIRKLSDRR